MDANTSKIGVLLANTGSPAAPTAPAVREYLKEFLSNPRIVPINPILWWIILRLFVLPKRGEASAEKYRAIWTDEGSPLLVNADNLAAALQELYRSQGLPITVKAAMSIGEPSIREAIAEFRAEGINRLVSIPLYPQSAFSTCKIAEDAIRATLKQMGWRPFIRYISGYSDNPLYVKAIANAVLAAGFKPGSTDKLIYSFHSVPLNDIER
ncbi:MAG: ferrochelatase, partial [Eggerthellaceae bacterium]|nr:ferrochelatase [Eggerthellaceae bacterium]